MWENRCKIALSGVGFSKVTRSAERPLAAHALDAVKAAVEDSGLSLSDIDGLATYQELPARGHATVDGISIVSVNCMMAMLKMHNLKGTYQNLPAGTHVSGADQFTAPYGFGGPGQGMAVAYTRWLERHNQPREKMATLAITQRKHGL